MLRRQVAQALQPVLTEFRQQSLRTVRQQLDQVHRTDNGEGRQRATPAPEPDREGERPPGQQGGREIERTAGAAESPASRPSTSDGAESIPDFVEQLGARWVQSLLGDGRDAVCSAPVRAGVREQVEHLVGPLLRAVLELVGRDSARRGLEKESERTLDEIVDDALDHLCSEGVLTDLQRRGEHAIRALVQGDLTATLRAVWEVIRTLLQALLGALRDQWERILHLLTDLVLKVAKEIVGTMLKDGLAALPVQEAEEKTESAQEKVKHKGDELKERLTERLETLQERVSEEVGKLKERMTEGLQSAVKEGTQGDSFGRPPTGRPPSLRPPTGRPPTGRPPSAQPPSGRPPSLTRRDT